VFAGVGPPRDRGHLVAQGYTEPRDDDSVVALGEVGLVGKVLRHERGYRAEKARPLRLWLPYEHWPLANRLGVEYGVPVSVTNPYRVEG